MSTLPRNFSWIEPSILAGCGRPESIVELEAAKREGIETIVSLTSTPLNPGIIGRIGFTYMHHPLSAMPSSQELAQIVEFIESQKLQSRPILIHCGEGKGRTGTVLAAYLVYQGKIADEAIQFVREKRPGSIQTAEQEVAIREFEKTVIRQRDK